ncbi:MAG: BMC domain-containing protein [Clostridia bacterium]|nr:BMC domain-containing protein [Clostridia bacterium]
MNSLGFVEVSGVVAAVDALDIMCKSADVSLVSWERKLGGRLVTLIVTGSVSAVNAAVENACARCIKKPVAHAVIANPHPETYRLAMLSAQRLEKKNAEKEAPETQAAEPAKEKVKAPAKKTTTKTGTTPKKTTKK